MEKKLVLEILERNGYDKEYFEEMDDNVIEGGTEEWMDVLSDIIGKNAYDQDNWTEEDYMKVRKFINVMENDLGLELL